MTTTPTAAVALIGNEILSGKVQDQNGLHLIGELRSLGVALRELRVVTDTVEDIGACVSALSRRYDLVITTGGVGPTHDDITLEGVAAGFAVPMVEHPLMLEHLHRVFPEDSGRRAAFSKMAQVPEGTTLIEAPQLIWPIYQFRNVYVFPGVPELFRRQFDAIKSRFLAEPFCLLTVYFRLDEGALAEGLTEAARTFSDVNFGSYPIWNRPEFRVRVTLECKDADRVEAGVTWLRERFGADQIYKVEAGRF